MIVNAKSGLIQKGPNLRYVPYCRVDWSQYDIIKTLFHGVDSLCSEGQENHPFIISKLGSVVGNHDGTQGVHFFDQERKELFETQKKIDQKAKYITILTESSKRLWEREFGEKEAPIYCSFPREWIERSLRRAEIPTAISDQRLRSTWQSLRRHPKEI